MPDSDDPLCSLLPQEPSSAVAKPDPNMPPGRSHADGRIMKSIDDKFRAIAEQHLAHLRLHLRLRPLNPPPPSLSTTGSPHEAALRSLGLLDFVRLDLQPASPRPDLVARLIAYYDPLKHHSTVHGVRLSVDRTDFVRALSLPPKPPTTARPPDVDHPAVVSAVLEFMKAYVLTPFQGDDMCILPQEIGAAEQAVMEGSAHKVDWAGLIWGLVEKEILEMPKRDDGVCYYGAYLQRLIWVQKPKVFELVEEQEKGEVHLEVSVDANEDEEDGDVDVMSKSLDQLDNVDLVAKSKSFDHLDSADVNTDVGSKILEESKIDDVDLRSNNLEDLESRHLDTRIKIIEKVRLRDLDDSTSARNNRSEKLEMVGEDANDTRLDEPKTTDELKLGLVDTRLDEPKTQDMKTSYDKYMSEATRAGDEDMLSVGVAEKDASPFVETLLVTRGEILAVPGEDEEADEEEKKETARLSLGISSDAEENETTGLSLGISSGGEEEKDETGLTLGINSDGEEKDTTGLSLGISSANDYDSMDVEENASVENLDEGDSGNEGADESEDDAFEDCRGGVEVNWRNGDEKGDGETAHCLQRCNSSAFAGMEFDNLNKGDVGMRDDLTFDDEFPGKMGSLHGMESTNLLQAMNSVPATYNGSENAHDLSSGDFLGMGADAHKDGIDLGTGTSFFFGNNGKRHIGDIDGYNDHMQAQGHFSLVNEQKRMRNDNNSSISPGSAVFNANFSEPIHNLLVKASMFYQQKERELQAVLVDKQNLANLLQEKEAFIQYLNSARCEQENKWQAELRRFEYDLNVMGQLVSGYKKALKQNWAAFDKYRTKFPCDKPRYVDVPGGGGLVLGVKELEIKRLEEEQKKLASANDMIEKFQHEWFIMADGWKQQIAVMLSRTEGLVREIDLLKERRKAEISSPTTEE